MAQGPVEVTIRAYNVGFGDCLLVSFRYARRQRHVLIDCGSTKAPRTKEANPNFLVEIAEDIREVCGGKLDAVVATHRHRDHISGFARAANGQGPGDILRALAPEVVIQPWTEDPAAPEDALVPVDDPGRAVAGVRHALRNMHQVAGEVAAFARTLPASSRRRKQLEFLGEENLANRPAVENLMTMGKRRKYVYFGSKSGLETLLPGVKTHVLGPPTLKQTEAIRKQTGRDPDEFWQLYRSFSTFWSFQAATSLVGARPAPFRRAPVEKPGPADRWIVDRLRALRSDSVLSIVRELDKQMNNTSVILLFETGGKRLLFPGDAQLENWMYALETLAAEGRIDLLEQVDLYKVGHHGSLNATPKSLWTKFAKRGAGLETVLSTRGGVHGSTERNTEVPRRTLVAELEEHSVLARTDTIKVSDGVLCRVVTIPLG